MFIGIDITNEDRLVGGATRVRVTTRNEEFQTVTILDTILQEKPVGGERDEWFNQVADLATSGVKVAISAGEPLAKEADRKETQVTDEHEGKPRPHSKVQKEA